MSQLTYFVPTVFACTLQDPQSSSDNPTPTGGATGAPVTGAPTTGTQADPNPNTGPNTGAAPQGPCASDTMMWMMPLMLVLMYFMIFRPEQKRKKEQAALLSAMKVGERVVMMGGMHGLITSLTDATVTVRAGDSNITFDRSAVARIVRDEAAAAGGK